MGVRIKEKVKINVNIVQQSINFIVNTIFQLCFNILKNRRLRPDYIIELRKIIEDGLFTWLSEQSLLSFHIEVYHPNRADALERWDTVVEYRADPTDDVVTPPVRELEKVCSKLARLPHGTKYRILVTLSPDASEVSGWRPGNFRPIDIRKDIEVGSGWGYGTLGAKMYYRGGTW